MATRGQAKSLVTRTGDPHFGAPLPSSGWFMLRLSHFLATSLSRDHRPTIQSEISSHELPVSESQSLGARKQG